MPTAIHKDHMPSGGPEEHGVGFHSRSPIALPWAGATKPAARRSRAGKSHSWSRPAAPDPTIGLSKIADKAIRPEHVTGSSEDVGNLIHFDSDFAGRYGYRAPISQGIQTMIWMMGALAAGAPPASFDVTARFIRPVYWDSEISLWADSTNAAPSMLRAVDGDGKAVAELRVDGLRYTVD